MTKKWRKGYQINLRPTEALFNDLEKYREVMGYRSIPQTVFILVSESVDKKLTDRGLKKDSE